MTVTTIEKNQSDHPKSGPVRFLSQNPCTYPPRIGFSVELSRRRGRPATASVRPVSLRQTPPHHRPLSTRTERQHQSAVRSAPNRLSTDVGSKQRLRNDARAPGHSLNGYPGNVNWRR
ncbi:hypothetical protein Trydic_g14504 [Trypoxylus dichotomus]